ncbi:polyprenyl synthetase family protein [Galbitalea sp. SE-J8]|uniref:polyprenyl synthetase family protein n=1 Tax=Galbitalea sp. SE-J8 TaxID=3054952 RepID=UPI00259CE6CA|nr:polyprenyl synthetase family protein [Galbitalea sp. SE-J8]MDM4762411.1 polyprenyl synthetase family protein [Galbitalea sp. SE-J8]
MTPSATSRRASRLSSSFGFGERLFASAEEKQLARELDDALERIEGDLRDDMRFSDSLADTTTRYLLEAGGKRVRPTLTLLTAQLGAGSTDDVLAVARAVELIHLASLYHDDVMDDATMRRGVPSAQHVWGNSVAILSGDLLFARASRLVAGLGEDAIRLQAETFERLCLGQLHETVGPEDGADPIAHYLRVLSDKTGSLIATAAETGVMMSGADAAYRAPVRAYGEGIGVAFQLVDDVIDLSPATDATGKRAGTDLRAGVATLPLLYLRAQAADDPDAAALLARLEAPPTGDDAFDDAAFDAAVAELRAHPVTERTLAEARRWAAEAVAALDAIPAGAVTRALIRFADSLVERQG